MREESRQQRRRTNPNSHGGQSTQDRRTMREWAERENEMMGGERGWGGREIGKRWGKGGGGGLGKAGQRVGEAGASPHHAFQNRPLRLHAEGGKFA